jgi:NADH:ubiquinone oxidoreductase subunit 5 (subunit L)/multisubunit Na+/H+ antiporter MnhA subunit
MYLLPIYIPLMNFLLFFLFGKFFSKKVVFLGTSLNILLNLLISFFIFYEVCILNINCEVFLCSWIKFNWLDINWAFYYDNLTAIMLIVINTISFAAHFYSIEYMEQDPFYKRFMTYLSLFTFFMIILVTAENLVQLFVGWEGVGISSYLLINFWYSRLEANKAAILAVLVNKVGDIALMLAISMLIYNCKTVSFGVMNYMLSNNFFFENVEFFKNVFLNNSIFFSIDNLNNIILTDNIFSNMNEYIFVPNNINYIEIIPSSYLNDMYHNITNEIYIILGIFLLLGVMAKSAQLGLHMWLPEAMEGPTPVSSLIHAATMVTAGIFLILRFAFFFEQIPYFLLIIFFLGSLTSIISTSIGVLQQDIKKVIAYSTCSQLAYMVAACGLSAYIAGFFHLYTHAFFKALLFLSSGYIIHIMNNQQDTRKLNNIEKYTLFFNIVFFTGSLSIAGFPFLSGFYSKENIIDLAVQSINSIYFSNFFYDLINIFNILEFISLIGTAYYSCRICINVSIQMKFNIYPKLANHFSIFYTLFSLFLLFLLTLCIGYFSYDFFLGIGNIQWISSLPISNYFFYTFIDDTQSLFLNKNIFVLLNNLEIYNNLEDILFLISCIGLSLFSIFSIKSIGLLLFYIRLNYKEWYTLFVTKFHVLNKYLEYMVFNNYNNALYLHYTIIEKGFSEAFLVYSNVKLLKKLNLILKKESKFLVHYILFMFIVMLLIINVTII